MRPERWSCPSRSVFSLPPGPGSGSNVIRFQGHRSRPADGSREASARRAPAPPADQLDGSTHGRRQSADQADRLHDRIEPQSRSPDPARRTRGCLPATPKQPRAVAALAHEGMGKRLPEWRRTVAPSSRKGVRGKPARRRRVGDTTAARGKRLPTPRRADARRRAGLPA